jgi:hypothetical protein
MPWAFLGCAASFLALLPLSLASPRLAAVVLYLQVSGVGPMLGSGFWLIVTERFDPRTAKRRFGQIAGAGTLGGLVGGLAAERIAATMGPTTTFIMLAAINLYCAWKIRGIGVAPPVARQASARASASTPEMTPGMAPEIAPPLSPDSARSGLRVLAGAPYLRNLAALVLLSTVGAELVDYLFKAEAVSAFGRGDTLLRFFAIYYGAVSVLTFLVQTAGSRYALERLGLPLTTGTPALALLAGGVGAWLSPGLIGIGAARGGESVLRGSLFRTGYEIFYTPVAPADKRAVKPIVDVGFDRLGDACGGAVIRVLLALAPVATQYHAILAAALLTSLAALFVASRLNRGYVQTLERSLLDRALELDLHDVEDRTTRTTMMRTLPALQALRRSRLQDANPTSPEPTRASAREATIGLDPELQEIIALRSRDRTRILPILRAEEGLTAALVPHVIPLLAWDPVAPEAVFALRKVAEEHAGQLIDALIDPNTEFSIRRRLARVFSICVSQRAADGLILGLEDMRFEVRYQCARALASILEKNPRVRIDRDTIFEIVRREAAVGRTVWRSQRLLQRHEEGETSETVFVDEFVKDRAGRSLAHVFTLLSLVISGEPLKIAFKGLHTDDPNLRGTALEYLEGVLPPSIRDPLWPFLEDGRAPTRQGRSREEVLAELLRSNQSIAINLEELRRGSSKS